jgi:hypothetical protein
MVRGTRLFPTHRHKNRAAVFVVTSGFLPATVGAVQVDGAVGQSGAVGVFIHALIVFFFTQFEMATDGNSSCHLFHQRLT